MKLLLYGTTFCHLCEQAKAMLHAAGVSVDHVDIAEDDALLEKYGTRIPVMKREDNGEELSWPFDEAALKHFIA